MSWRARMVDFLFPPKCPFCRRVTEGQRVCPKCEKALPWTEGKDREQVLSGGLRCASPLWYEDLAREGILRFKFHGGAGAEVLGALLADCAAERYSGEFDLVTWVPVSKKRRRKRGYDQTELLARSACRLWETEPVRLLQKVTDNPAQSGLKEEAARRANVLGVYEAAEPERIQGCRILLVDDICTTGATLAECARMLRDAGAADVMCVCAALARRPEKKP